MRGKYSKFPAISSRHKVILALALFLLIDVKVPGGDCQASDWVYSNFVVRNPRQATQEPEEELSDGAWGETNVPVIAPLRSNSNNKTGINPDELTTPDLIKRAGFTAETHWVTTDDEYILTLHRIPPKEYTDTTRVILFAHGLLGASDMWFVNDAEKNLPLVLAKQGWDVWLTNARGNYYSKNHTTKSPEADDFWNFSFHEVGIYDTRSFIDYILQATGREQLNYLGHSVGSTALLVLFSERPEYNDKINVSISYAPLAYMPNVKTPLIRSMSFLLNNLPKSELGDVARSAFIRLEFWPRYGFLNDELLRTYCKSDERLPWCAAFLFTMMGFDFCQANMDHHKLLQTIYPSGTAIKTIVHFAQVKNSGTFQQYDNGPAQNALDYDQPTPRLYNLTNVRTPQTIFWGDNDWLATPTDVDLLTRALPPGGLKESCRVKFKQFNHIDFLLAKDVDVLLNQRVLRVLDGHSCFLPDSPGNEGEDPGAKCTIFQNYPFETLLPRRLRARVNRVRQRFG